MGRTRIIDVADRPYLIAFRSPESGYSEWFPLSSEEVRQLIARWPVRTAGRWAVTLYSNGADTERYAMVQPATAGGGQPFTLA